MFTRQFVLLPLLATLLCSLVFFQLALAAPAETTPVTGQLVLAADGQSDYQIVLPDQTTTLSLTDSLQQVARMVQVAFKANGFDVPVVTESEKLPDKPAIYLGDTAAARAAGIEANKIKGWGYHLQTYGKDVLIVGHDNTPVVTPDKKDSSTRGVFERLGTAKGVVDFLRQYVGVRFLYPQLGNERPLSNLSSEDLLNTPAIEYLPAPRIALPADLNSVVDPHITFMYSHRGNTDFYHLTMNRFPRVDQLFRGHTWADAIPPSRYGKDHPEYFALLSGKRLDNPPKGTNAQYCISNPEVQEIFYQDLVRLADMGYTVVDLGQPDGFRPCQCDNCKKLYDTADWGEKIWTLHRNLAQRLYESHPDVTVCIMSYIQTKNPPTTFKTFPPNVRIMLTGVNKHETTDWENITVPRGYSGYAYYWTPNLTTRYTPMATPNDLEQKVRDLIDMHIHSLYLDTSGGLLFGLEGPAYYTMGRMFDDPKNNNTNLLVNEFIEGAFGKRAGQPMLAFYDALNHNVEIYARYLATRAPAWTISTGMGRSTKSVKDPFRLLGFLYTPDLMTSMEAHLANAEKRAESDKIKQRLALVRREFEYLKNFAKVTHLYQAYQLAPTNAMLTTLLDAIDARNEQIHAMFDNPIPGWPKDTVQTFPPAGHSYNHLIPAYNTYQTPFVNTFVNWDTKAMRAAMDQTTSSASILHADGTPVLDDQQWQLVEPLKLKHAQTGEDTQTQVRVLHGNDNLYVQITTALPAKASRIHLHLQPTAGSEVSYRFAITPGTDSREQAVRGMVSDVMDPRYGQYDPDWKANWQLTTKTDKDHQWTAMLTIPYATLKTVVPNQDTPWHANVIETFDASGKDNYAAWSAQPGSKSQEDAKDFGQWTFDAKVAMNPIRRWRDEYDSQKKIVAPKDWLALDQKQQLKFGPWLFQADGLDQGITQQWFKPDNFKKDQWTSIAVPSFWAENEKIGKVVGFGWYHTTLPVSSVQTKKAVRIWFNSVDEQAWVYVNGKLVGEHTIESTGTSISSLWEEPFMVNVPADLLHTGDNTLVVRVHNAVANGGIWRPVYAGVVE